MMPFHNADQTDLVETVARAICASYAAPHEGPDAFWQGNEENHRNTARAALAAIEAAGRRVVPTEPTADMWRGWISVNHEYDPVIQHARFNGDIGNWRACWDACLAAAPNP